MKKEPEKASLTQQQKDSNKHKPKVEYVFGFMENSMGRIYNRKIGIKRAETVIGLMNLTYDMFGKIQLTPSSQGAYARIETI